MRTRALSSAIQGENDMKVFHTTRSKRDRLHYHKHAWQAVHQGEYKIHPHKIISEVS